MYFVSAINGEFEGYATVPTRDEFFASDDDALKLMYSFGTNKLNYLWNQDLEPVKVNASKMISLPSIHERRLAYRKFIQSLVEYCRNGGTLDKLECLEGLQRLERIQKLKELNKLLGALTISHFDYRDVNIPAGAVVYADVPYKNTDCRGYANNGAFNYDEFEKWLLDVPFMVVISESSAPSGCIEIARNEKFVQWNIKKKEQKECLFVQEKFVDEYKKRMSCVKLF